MDYFVIILLVLWYIDHNIFLFLFINFFKIDE